MYVAEMTDDQIGEEVGQLFKDLPTLPPAQKGTTPSRSRVRYLRSLLCLHVGRREAEILRRYLNILRHHEQTSSYRVWASDVERVIKALESL